MPTVHACHAIVKGLLILLTPYLHVSDMHIAKANLVDDSFLVLLGGFLEDHCCLQTWETARVILVVLPN